MVLAILTLPSTPLPRISVRLVTSTTSESAIAATTRRVVSATYPSRSTGSVALDTSSSTSMSSAALPSDRDLAAGKSDVGSDDYQTMPIGATGRPDLLRGQRL